MTNEKRAALWDALQSIRNNIIAGMPNPFANNNSASIKTILDAILDLNKRLAALEDNDKEERT